MTGQLLIFPAVIVGILVQVIQNFFPMDAEAKLQEPLPVHVVPVSGSPHSRRPSCAWHGLGVLCAACGAPCTAAALQGLCVMGWRGQSSETSTAVIDTETALLC